MTAIAKQFYGNQPTTSIGILYTAPSTGYSMIKSIKFVNTTGIDAKVDLYIVPSAGAPAVTNKYTPLNFTISATGFIKEDCSEVVPPNATIQGVQVTAGAITVFISGVEVS